MARAPKDTGTWIAAKGFNHPPGSKRQEVGDVVTGLLWSSVKPLLDMEAITPHDDTANKLADQHTKG